MKLIAATWWLGFWTALGLIVGSFLNVVIYRLPRRQSLRVPLWSACPHCGSRIAWYDNLPILSFTLLRGRCRHCGATIASRYLVIEAAMALIVLVLVDAFMIGHVRAGLRAVEFGLTDSLAYDWPILTAHVILFACLLAMSAIDLEHYWVDIRFTNFVAIAGFILHSFWTPRHSMNWPRPSDTTAIVCLLALAGLVFTWIVLIAQEPFWQPADEDDAAGELDAEALNHHSPLGDTIDPPAERSPVAPGIGADDHSLPRPIVGNGDFAEPASPNPLTTPHAGDIAIGGEPVKRDRVPPLFSKARAFGWVAAVLLAVLFTALIIEGGEVGLTPLNQPLRALLPAFFFFALIVSESAVARESDQEIVQAIEDERHTSRKMVAMEMGLLLPAAALGIIGLLVMTGQGAVSRSLSQGLHTTLTIEPIELLRHWQPLYGFATAASGFIIAGALGWAVRIVFTAVYGREAFGTGDIHLMAAAGCVAGWQVVLLGFVLTCGISLLGWAATLPFKRSRALPLGPWLSLAFLLLVVFYDTIITWKPIRETAAVINWFFLENSQPARMIISP